MRHGAITFATACAASLALGALAHGDVPPAARPATRPVMLQQDPESIYAIPEVPRESDGVNLGGVNLDLTINYLTDYVFRGIDRSEAGDGSEDAPNLQFDGRLTFNLGRLPHPFVGLFVNVYDDDPVSRFQEVRPFVGLEWDVKPLKVAAGQTSYIFPEREEANTAEIFLRVELNDAFLWKSDRPVLTPYVFVAYDYDLYDGLYAEAGVRHDFPIEGTGIVVTAMADVAYGTDYGLFSTPAPGGFGPAGAVGKSSGFQHYDVGLTGAYSLNKLLNISRRYGEWRLNGYIFYTDGIDNELRSDTQVWGGVGINFRY